MKKYYVYEIVNLMGTIEYVGETTMPKRRFYSHTKIAPKKGLGAGKFYKRLDVFMNIVSEFDNKKDAFDYQCNLQLEYGIDTDRVVLKRNGFKEAHTHFGHRFAIPIIAYNKYGKYVGEYKSTSEAANKLGICQPSISNVINGKIKHAKGYTFFRKIVK
jgi:predicted GIY-YIG superfamily endonuclease